MLQGTQIYWLFCRILKCGFYKYYMRDSIVIKIAITEIGQCAEYFYKYAIVFLLILCTEIKCKINLILLHLEQDLIDKYKT